MGQDRRFKRGPMTVLALFVLGGLFLAGLYLTAYFSESAEYRASTPGIPDRRLRVVSWNLQWKGIPAPSAIAALRPFNADFILLQRVAAMDAQAIAAALEMRAGGSLQMYYSPGEGGNAVLSRHELHKGRSIPRTGQSASPGIWAEPLIDGRRFLVASVEFAAGQEQAELQALVEKWKPMEMPLIIGSAPPPTGPIPLEPFSLKLVVSNPQAFPEGAQNAAVYFSTHWRGEAASDGAGPLVVDLAPESATTHPVTVPAEAR